MPARVTILYFTFPHFPCLSPCLQTLSCAPGYTASTTSTATCAAAGSAWVVTNNCVASTTGTGTCPALTTAQFTATLPAATFLSFATGTGATAYTGLLTGLTLVTALNQANATVMGVAYTTSTGAVTAVGVSGTNVV